MTEPASGGRARALMLGLPRPLRWLIAAWVLAVMFTPPALLVAFLALLPFGRQEIINAGPGWEYCTQIFLPASLVAATPLAVVVAVDRWFGNASTTRARALEILKRAALVAAVWFWAMISLALLKDFAAPVVANALLRPPVQEWTLDIIDSRIGRPGQSRDCPNRLSFDIPAVSPRVLSVCAYRNTALFEAGKGDVLHLAGRSGPFGITYREADLRLEKTAR